MDYKRTHILHWNCRNKEECFTGERCCSENVTYQAKIYPMENCNDEKVYIGISARNWKQWLCNHWHSFPIPLLRNQTALSKCFLSLSKRGLTSQIKWRFIKIFSTPNTYNSRCNLCLEEKINLIKYKTTWQLLNKRNELISKYKHKCKFKLIWYRFSIEMQIIVKCR